MEKTVKSNLDYISQGPLYTEYQKRFQYSVPNVYEGGWKFFWTKTPSKDNNPSTNFGRKSKNTSDTPNTSSIPVGIGTTTIRLPIVLKEIAQSIEEAKEILSLKEDWDDFGANATNIPTFMKAVDFLITYSEYLLKDGVIVKPFIDIMRDGSVSVLWENDKASILIIFKKDSSGPYYMYGEVKKENGSIPFKYAIEDCSKIDEIVSKWLSQNLIQNTRKSR